MEVFAMKRLYAILAIVVALGLNFAMAAPTCTIWNPQPDGSYWRMCVDDNGKTYCEQSVNNKITRISCKAS